MRKQSYRNIKISKLNCPICDSSMFVPRFQNRQRGTGHIKDLYCWKCKKVQKMVEIANFY